MGEWAESHPEAWLAGWPNRARQETTLSLLDHPLFKLLNVHNDGL